MMSYYNLGGPVDGQAWPALPPDILHKVSRDGFSETRRRNSNIIPRNRLLAKRKGRQVLVVSGPSNLIFSGSNRRILKSLRQNLHFDV